MAKRSAPPSTSDGTAPKKAARGGNAAGPSDGRGGGGGAGRRIQQDMSPNSGAAPNSNSAGGGAAAAAEGGREQQQGRRSRSASPNPSAAAAAGSNAAATPGGNSAGAASAAAASTKDTAAANASTSPGNAAAGTTTTSRPPSRLSTRSSPDDKNSGSGKPPREVQVKELLAHRRLLLERIRQCRSAASLRLREGPSRSVASMSNSNSSNNNTSGGSGGSSNNAATAAASAAQPANEIEAFKLLTQQAIAATRRERQSSVAATGTGAGIGGAGGATAPAERGLRRGGSVGKRMAAAVSTLQNAGSIGGWVSDSSTGTGASGSTSAATAGGGGGGGSSSKSGGKNSKSAAAAAAGGAGAGGSASSAAGAASTGKQLSATTATAVSMEGGAKKGKKRPKASESPPPPGAAGSEAGATVSTSMAATKAKKSKSSSGGGGGDRDKKKKGGSGQSGASGSSASQQQQSAASAAAMRQHHQNALTALGQSDPETLALISRPRGQEARILKQYASNPRVVHPQGRSLRARRDALRDRLEKMVTERRDREARWLGQGLQRNGDGGNIGATAPPPPAGESPTSVAEKMAGSNALKELVKSRPQFKTYALAQSSVPSATSAGSQPLSRASTPPPGGPGRRSPVPPSQPYRPEPRNPSSSSRPTPRRKTHWDYVLEEMKWTATDFESERRWKGAVGRTLGASVLAFHASNGGGKGSPLKSAKSAGSAAKGPGGSTKKKKRKTEGSEDDPATVAEAAEEDLEPTIEDLDRARIISKGLSVLIAGHWELAAGESASSASGSGRDVASSDGTKLAGLSDDTANANVIYRRYTEVVKGVPGMGNSKAAKRIHAPTSDDKEEGDRNSSTNPSHETVTARLEAAIKRANLVGTQPSKKKRPVESADCTVDLQPSQVDAIHFVEAVWEVGSDDDAPTLGVALSGKVASGKTVAMAATIWRHGDEGPQILFCHAARLIRWRHELRRFGNLNVLTYGNLGWQFDGDQERSFKAGDVILCEFSSLLDFLANVGKGVVSGAATVTVDSRCPQSDAVAQRSSVGVSLQQAPSSAIALPEVASSEVTSTKWWKHLLHALTSTSMASKRLLIEGPASLEEVLGESPSSSNEKKRVELLAMKMAYIHHPRTFCAGHGNVGRSVISWAKKHHRGNAPSEPTAKTDLGALKNVLRENISALCHTQEMYEQPKAKQKPAPSWELRLCTFPELQRQAYEECCSFVRGSLTLSSLRLMGITASSTASRAQRNAQTLWAQAILRLRRVCVHSNLDDAAQITPLTTSSSSQLEDAKKVLMNSAKMQELTNVLLSECGYEIASGESDDEVLGQILPDTSEAPGGGAAKKTKRKKVLILASLPEAQTVVSKLLTSLGIAHGKLRSSSSSSSPPETGTDIVTKEDSIIDSLAWIENQHILSRFNTRVDATVSSGAANRALPSSACDVLLASPSTIGSQYGGLSASSADVVISLDEDWSGHSQRLIESILARNLMHHCLLENPSSSKPRPKWIKLVCDDSCEKIFLFREGDPTKSNQDEAEDAEPEDPSPPKKKQKRGGGRKGRKGKAAEKVVEKKATPSKTSDTSQGSQATYISSAKVLQFRNKALKTVLGKHCSIDESQFPDPSDSIFLPSLLGEESNNLPAAGDAENNPTLNGNAPAAQKPSLNDVAAPFSNALLHEEALASSFLAGIEDSTDSNVPVAALSSLTISRRDVSSICVRTYVQQLARALSSSSSGSNKQPSMLIANGAAGRLRLSGSDTDLADSWCNSGLGCDPIEVAASTLSLRPEIILKDDNVNIDLSALAHTTLEVPTVIPIHDGSEGQDELVYFPPSFPGMLPNAYRKMAEEEQRKRTEKKSAAASDAVSTTSAAGGSAFMGGKQASSKGKRARNSKGGRSSTAAPLTPTALTNISSSASPSANHAAGTSSSPGRTPTGFAEDSESTLDTAFGMPGLPDSRISAQSAAKTLTGCLSYPYLDEDAVDFGDADACPEIGSMLLFTKKGTNLLRRASSLMPTYGAYGMQAAAAGGKKSKKGLPQQLPSMGMQPNNGGPPPGSDSMQTTGQIWDSRALNLLAQRGINPHTSLRHASVRMRHRLNDRVTQLFITTGTSLGTGHGVPQLYANESAALGSAASRLSLKRALNAPCRTDFGPFNVGFLASKDGMVGIKPKKRKLGITLPMGVRIPQHRDMMRPFPRSGADADEQWSKGEDEKLIESVLRWKDNWHLISNTVSHMTSGVNVWEKSGRYRAIRSPRQCRERWAMLNQSRPDLQVKWTAVETSVGDLVVPGGAFKALRNALAYSEAHPPVALSPSDKDAGADADTDASTKPKEKVIGIIQSSLLLRRAVGDIVTQAKQDLSKEKTVPEKVGHLGSDSPGKSTESSTPQPDQAVDSAFGPSPNKASIGSRLANMKRAMSKRQKPKLQVPGAPPGSSSQAVPLVGSHPSHAQAVEYAVTQATGASGMAPPRMEMWPLQILDYADRVRSAKTGEPLPTPRRAKARSSGSTATLSSHRHATSAGTSPTPSTRQAPPMITTPNGAFQYQRAPGQQSYPPASQRTASHGTSASSQGVPTRGGGPIGSYVPQMPPHGSGSGSGIPKPTVVGATGVPIQPTNRNAPPPPAPTASASASAAAATSSNRHVPPLPPAAGNGGRPSTGGAAAPAGPAAPAQNTSGAAAAKSPAPSSSSSQPPPSTQK